MMVVVVDVSNNLWIRAQANNYPTTKVVLSPSWNLIYMVVPLL